MRMKVHGSSSISSTRNVKTSTVQPHCSELGKVQGGQLKTMSAKGEFSKLKNENLKFAGKAKTMGDSNFILESKLYVISAGKVQDQPGTREPPGPLDLRERTNGETGGQARGERQAQLKKIHSDEKILCPDEDQYMES